MINNQPEKYEPQVTIIIPSYNGSEDILSCLESVTRSVYNNFQIIVVDNASTDNTVDLVQKNYPKVKLIEQDTNTGFTGACLKGFTEAQKLNSEYIALINQDLTVDTNWLSVLVAHLNEHSETVAVQPIIFLAQDKTVIHSAGNKIHFLGFGFTDQSGRSIGDTRAYKYTKEPKEINYASGAAVLLRMKDLEQIGLFSEEFFMYGEDLDLGWRIRLIGKKSELVPTAKAYHRYEFHRSTRIKYEYGERNRLINLITNYRWLTVILIFPAWFIMESGILFFSLWKGWFILKIKGYMYVIVHLDKILEERRRHQKMRLAGDRKISEDFASQVHYQEEPSVILKAVNPLFKLYWFFVRLVLWW